MKINKSASRTVDLLSLLSQHKKPMTLTEISSQLKIPKSSTFEIVYTLVEKGFLEVDDDQLKTFKMGMKLFEVGVSFLNHTDLHQISRPLLDELMAKTGDTVFLAVEDNGEIVYLDKVESYSSAIRSNALLGSRNKMYYTGLGKALLASYSNEKVKQIIGSGSLPTRTDRTIKHYEELILELAKIRERGFSIDDRESEPELYCFAAPIYDRSGKAVAAVSVATLYSKVTPETYAKFSQSIVETGLEISKRLGYIGKRLY
ncbi:IclR family transcriptional regulator [Paenibacillus koleovorans]|uniref:IclR family transcriptional regulator n=1 Tax=Paenibacillus koleovorans TaxID=121608 RepID=UPI000FD878DD|nr:IclR family transcriptional regulator [Paenibacillus koleovorans]